VASFFSFLFWPRLIEGLLVLQGSNPSAAIFPSWDWLYNSCGMSDRHKNLTIQGCVTDCWNGSMVQVTAFYVHALPLNNGKQNSFSWALWNKLNDSECDTERRFVGLT
jgi:hypothetical protein